MRPRDCTAGGVYRDPKKQAILDRLKADKAQ